jgi:GUN4-like
MIENQNNPQEDDAVLGGNSKVYSDAVLGGVGGVKWRLENASFELKLLALSDALKYGNAGLDAVMQGFRKQSGDVYQNLWQQAESDLKQALNDYTISNKLPSIVGVDYRKLNSLLATQKWQEADRETAEIMLWVSNQQAKGLLTLTDIQSFPKLDLYTLDHLWENYSQGRFGLSRQNQIWQSVGGRENANYEIWYQFCEQVGWRVKDSWVEYEKMAFHLNAPNGHLPFLVVGGYGVVVCLQHLFDRLDNWLD